MSAISAALNALIETIEGTGGVTRDTKGNLVPVADEDWVDLAHAYVQACTALGREPVIVE